MKYDVFISYSRRDYVDEQKNVLPGNVVSTVKEALSAAGISYWFDEDGIYSGKDFAEEMLSAIEDSEILVFLSSENSNRSDYTSGEIAYASQQGKHIIPVRLDDAPYNKKVLLSLYYLDYIEYYVNPEKGLADLVAAIRRHLDEVEDERRRRREEEERQRELKRKQEEERRLQKEREDERRRQEQNRLVGDIRIACTALNNEEAKLELDRETLLLKAEGVADEGLRGELTATLRAGGAIRSKCRAEYEERLRTLEGLTPADVEAWKEKLGAAEADSARLRAELAALAKTCDKQTELNFQLKNAAAAQAADHERAVGQLNRQFHSLRKELKNAQDALANSGTPGASKLPLSVGSGVVWLVASLMLGLLIGLVVFRTPPMIAEDNPVEETVADVFDYDSVEVYDTVLVDKVWITVEYTVAGVEFSMASVPGGTFTMGATPEQKNASDDEMPAHQVTLSSYLIGETEVTQELWEAVMGNNPSRFRGGRLPVENVSWYDCQEFIQRLNALLGESFRLPTEAEWEFAARGGELGEGCLYSGSDRLDDVAWYEGNSNQETHPVAEKRPNRYGLYDLSGNVWEWCQDWKGDYVDAWQTDPSGPASGTHRVGRGGSWAYDAKGCRVAFRYWFEPSRRYNNLGFRLAR